MSEFAPTEFDFFKHDLDWIRFSILLVSAQHGSVQFVANSFTWGQIDFANLETSFVGKNVFNFFHVEQSRWLQTPHQKYSGALDYFADSLLYEPVVNRFLSCDRQYSQICLEQGNSVFNDSNLLEDVAAARRSCNLMNSSIQ